MLLVVRIENKTLQSTS